MSGMRLRVQARDRVDYAISRNSLDEKDWAPEIAGNSLLKIVIGVLAGQWVFVARAGCLISLSMGD